ncbi:hypothetical protein B0T22DRAFT_25447 [Podospora appendiculata]|uniref:Proteophosphoglycan 5 n=1 Tax=Podospora appendiculata TaxID=314037 RepID=A0AAE0XGE3_9PEZI|nr:hypothetical protein B0T22DRAFT_25447 [Podospora appendiculata]
MMQQQQEQQQPPQSQQQAQYIHKSTPGRRRTNRHSALSPAHKNYASESDMPSEFPFPIDLVSGSPYTPRKSAANSPAPSSIPINARSKPRTANKARPKNGPTSPAPPKQGRVTPPQAALPRAVTAAFAGATFHASPAPSSLPIPSFFTKALDSPRVKDTGRASQEPSPPATDSEAPTPQHRSIFTDVPREESPLDLFFRADRAEKERARRASSANIFASAPRPFSPPKLQQSPQEPRTLPAGLNSNRARRPAMQRNLSSGISYNELDGTPGRPMGPAFSTPYQDRIRAARSSEKQPEVAQKPPQGQEEKTNADLSEKLKQFLSISSIKENVQEQRENEASPSYGARQIAPGVQRVAVTTTTTTTTTKTTATASAAPADHGRPAEILNMEDSLRRMLKIDSGLALHDASPINYRRY